MPITRVEGVTYGVTDLDLCSRFLTDMGLKQDAPRPDGSVVFLLPVNQFIRLVAADSKDEPPPLAEGSAVREIIWGVDTPESLEAMAKDLATDHEVRRDSAGVYHTIDPGGCGRGLMLSRPV
jgi:hypothetical protein